MSWELFLEEFKRRHPKDYGLPDVLDAPVVPKVEPKEVAVEVKKADPPKPHDDSDDWDAIEIIDDDEPDEYWK